MELVWGPELSYTESNSQVYKFLGSEKYTSVLNSIYAGLGVPPTLTGMANNGGGFTNNFISLKTLVERLQYGRDQLTKFSDFKIMGFTEFKKEVEKINKEEEKSIIISPQFRSDSLEPKVRERAKVAPRTIEGFFKLLPGELESEVKDVYNIPVSYTHLTLPTNREV